MKKFRILGVLLVGVFAVAAMLASTASAEITLLAEWLIKAAAVVGEPETKTEGEVTLEDTKAPLIGKAAVLCSGILDGTVTKENGLGWVLKVLNLAGVEILPLEGEGILCAAVTGCEGTDAEAWPVGLPWHLEVILKEASAGVEPMFLLIILLAEWHVVCLVLGTTQTDNCSSTNGTLLIENDAVGGTLVNANEAVTPAGTCSLGGAGSANDFADADTLTLTVSGEALSVSSEGE